MTFAKTYYRLFRKGYALVFVRYSGSNSKPRGLTNKPTKGADYEKPNKENPLRPFLRDSRINHGNECKLRCASATFGSRCGSKSRSPSSSSRISCATSPWSSRPSASLPSRFRLGCAFSFWSDCCRSHSFCNQFFQSGK